MCFQITRLILLPPNTTNEIAAKIFFSLFTKNKKKIEDECGRSEEI
jgi:hypothetical protein